MGPGAFFGPILATALDADKNGDIPLAELQQAFQTWFDAWNTDPEPSLTEAELRAGIDRDLAPFRGGPPGFGLPQ
jgi:hypothetical protein